MKKNETTIHCPFHTLGQTFIILITTTTKSAVLFAIIIIYRIFHTIALASHKTQRNTQNFLSLPLIDYLFAKAVKEPLESHL